MNLLSLKYFIAITEYSSFTKAAEHLYVTQPTLSRQIADLEDEFGVQLFNRGKRSLSLTPAGEICLKEAREIVARCDNLTQRLKHINGEVSGTLNVGYFWHFNQDILVKPLQMMSNKHPNINIGLVKASFAELNHFLMDGTFDLIYTSVAGVGNLSNVSVTKIAKNELRLVVPHNHPLAARDSIRIKELENEQFIMLERSASPYTVDSTIQMCVSNGFSPTVVHYAKDAQTIFLMVCAGKGVAFLPTQKEEGDSPFVKYLKLEDCDLDYDIVLVHKIDNPNPLIPLYVSQFRNESV